MDRKVVVTLVLSIGWGFPERATAQQGSATPPPVAAPQIEAPAPAEPAPVETPPTEPLPSESVPPPSETLPASAPPAAPAPGPTSLPTQSPQGYPPQAYPPQQPPYYAPPTEPAPLEDPTIHTHDAFYLRMGIGYSHLFVTASSPDASGEAKIEGGGVGIDLMFGGTPAPGLVIGGGIQGASFPTPKLEDDEGNEIEADEDLTFSSVGPFIDYYFDPHGGFHLQGFVAYGVLADEDDDTDDPTGFVASLGFGHEWWIGEQWGLGILGSLHYAHLSYDATLFDDDDITINLSTWIPSILLSATYH